MYYCMMRLHHDTYYVSMFVPGNVAETMPVYDWKNKHHRPPGVGHDS